MTEESKKHREWKDENREASEAYNRHIQAKGSFSESVETALSKLRKYRGKLSADFNFDREEINTRS